MSNVSDTSVEAYAKYCAANKVSPAQQTVLYVLAYYGPQTRQDIARLSGLSLSSVCGRVRELVLEGAICNHERVQDVLTGCGQWKLKIKEDSDVQKS